MAVGIEVHDQAAEVFVFALAADDGDGAAVEVGGGVGVGLGDGVAGLEDGAGLGHDDAGAAGDEDVHVAELGGELLLVVDLLEVGGQDDLVAAGGDERVDVGLDVGGQGVEVVGPRGNGYGSGRPGDGDEAGRGDAGEVRRAHADHADFFAAALDDGGLGELGVGRRGVDARVVLPRVRGEGADVADLRGVAGVQRGVGAEVQVRAEEGEGGAVVAHARAAGLRQRQDDVRELAGAEVELVVADTGRVEADGVHDRDVRAAGVFAEVHAAGVVVEGKAEGGLERGAGGDVIAGGHEGAGDEAVAGTDGDRGVVAGRVFQLVNQSGELRCGGDGGDAAFHVRSMEELQAEGGRVDFIDSDAADDAVIDVAFVAHDCQHGVGRAVCGVDDGHGFRTNQALVAVIDVTDHLR